MPRQSARAAGPRVWAGRSFLFHLILIYMKVQILKVGVCAVPRVRLVEALLDQGISVTLSDLHITVELDEWVMFLRAFYRACAKMSRTEEGYYLSNAFAVRVLYGERWYATRIWYDNEARGVRYGSLS